MLRLIAFPDARTPRRSPLSSGRALALPLGVALSGLLAATTAVAQPAPQRQPAAGSSAPAAAPRQPGGAAAQPGATPSAAASPSAAPPAATPQPGGAPPGAATPPGATSPGAAAPYPPGPPYPAAPYPAPPQQVPQTAPGYPPPGYPPPGSPGYPPPGYPPPGYPPPGVQGGYAPYGGAYPPPGYPPAAAELPPTPPPVPLRRKNPGLMLGGIALTAGGTIAFFAGTGLLASASERYEIYCDFGGFTDVCDTRSDGPRQVAGALISVAGGVMLAVGIPLWIIGGKKVPATDEAPKAPAQTTLSLGPGSATLHTRF
ncbi:hypothetical protein [Sorangium sp. So ce406]|uniref:hypothetical protein n=1 Tax=Sorangium sp. So ce406 TaxID=3133311 RepID=UPI003F5B8316